MSLDYIKYLLVEWGRIDAGQLKSPLRMKTVNYGERIGVAFRIDDMPISNPDVGRIAAFMPALPKGEFEAIYLQYHEDKSVTDACQAMGVSRDKFHDLTSSALRMLDHWLRVDRATNGNWSRYLGEMSRQIAQEPKASSLERAS